MLTTLSIRNLALIERLELNFSAGFTALTGETGAGKSILLDALGLVLGNRADSALVRHGSERADIQAVFDLSTLPDVRRWLEEEALLDEDSPETLLVRRTVSADGGSRAWINGVRAPAAQLRVLGKRLVEIHGQHAHQQLLQSAHQRTLLDGFGGLREQSEEVAERWRALQRARQALAQAEQDTAGREARLDELARLLKDLEALAPTEDDYHELSRQQHRLAHAETLLQNGLAAEAALTGDEGATRRISEALDALHQAAEIEPALTPMLQQLEEQRITLEELARDIHHLTGQVELDPQQLAEVDARLGEYHRLARLHLCDPEALEARLQELQEERHRLAHADEHLETLRTEVETARAAFMEAAERLSAARLQAGAHLAETVTPLLHPLGMPHAELSVRIDPTEPGRHGIDQITFLFTANPGQPPRPLGKVASGGELARLSLALEVALADVTGTPTLIFDEVDTGIGGGVAEQVGRLMRQLGGKRQVMAVTHQPQVAACAHHHLKVEKTQRADSTATHV
ncbi:DNA repair protein RecN, partial [Sulfurivirga sp.]|uniref:DNA repair protein RecN n=1 Tax=Sulfurivirga sp. TaxID=2614236 RepID=UPI0025D7B8AF